MLAYWLNQTNQNGATTFVDAFMTFVSQFHGLDAFIIIDQISYALES